MNASTVLEIVYWSVGCLYILSVIAFVIEEELLK